MDLPELDCSALSHTGPVREDNQDAVLLPDPHLAPDKGYLFALADGIGGYANGAMASRMALDSLAQSFYNRIGDSGQTSLRRGVENANLELFKTADVLACGRMGTTLTAAFVCGRSLFLAHVGDSRAYLLRDGKASNLTNDHTTVGDLVRMRVIGPEKVRAHPSRSILTRAVGLKLFVSPDFSRHDLKEGDCLLLCSDGVWSVVEDGEFAWLAGEAQSAAGLCHRLIELALARETDDNISVVAVYARRLAPRPLEAAAHSVSGWAGPIRRLIPALFHKEPTC